MLDLIASVTFNTPVVSYKYPIGFEFYELSNNKIDKVTIVGVSISITADLVDVKYRCSSSIYSTDSHHDDGYLDRAAKTKEERIQRLSDSFSE